MNINNLKDLFIAACCFGVALCLEIQCMDKQKADESDQPASFSTLNEIKLDSDIESLTPHPGGLFKQNQKSQHWAVQCQGCNSWLISTETNVEPEEKTINPTDEIMQRFHMKTCRWKHTD